MFDGIGDVERLLQQPGRRNANGVLEKAGSDQQKGGNPEPRLRKPGKASALLRSLRVKISPRANGADAEQRGDSSACDLGNRMSQLDARSYCISGRGRFRRSRSPSGRREPATGGQSDHGGKQDELSHAEETPPFSEICKAARVLAARLAAKSGLTRVRWQRLRVVIVSGGSMPEMATLDKRARKVKGYGQRQRSSVGRAALS